MGKNGAAAARERARAAKARVDAARAGHEQQIEDQVTNYYLAADALAAAETAAAQARADLAASVGALVQDLKEPVERVAALCGITPAEARTLRKAAKDAPQTPTGQPVTPVRGRGTGEPAPDQSNTAATTEKPTEPDPAAAETAAAAEKAAS